MTYNIGGVTVHGEQPSNVISVAFGRKVTDGGKARIKARRDVLGLSDGAPDYQVDSDSLVMLHADVVDTSPCEMGQDSGDCA